MRRIAAGISASFVHVFVHVSFAWLFMLAQPFEIVAHRIIFRPPLTRSCTFGLDPYPFFPPFFSNIHSFFQNDRCRREARDIVVRYFRILKLKEWKKLEKLIREDIELKWKCSLSFEKNSTRNPFESCNSFKSLYHQIRTYKNILVKLPP